MNVIEFRGAAPDEPAVFRQPRPKPVRWWNRRWFRILIALVILAIVAFVCVAEYVIHNAEPILRNRIIETLSAKFDAPVELDELHISLVRGVDVEGRGLRIPYGTAPVGATTDKGLKPLISVQSFNFHTLLVGLLRQPTRIGLVTMTGVEVHIPPKAHRPDVFSVSKGRATADPTNPRIRPKLAFILDRLYCADVKLFIETDKPGKEPLEFDIGRLQMEHVDPSSSMRYSAQLVNPKPVGDIDASGHIGPWINADPRQSPIDGDYTFNHADLNTIKGIGGILSSTGRFGGQLGEITVDGETDTPNFSVDTSNHPVPLHTKFHAIVDGTTGDTYLQPVQAHMLHSDFTAEGKVVKVPGRGHDILLDVTMPHARMEDMLQLAVKTNPPLMRGVLKMKTHLHIPPGEQRVMGKLDMQGTFSLNNVSFSNPDTQNKIDGMSARAQGKPKDVEQVANDRLVEAESNMKARFNLAHGMIQVDDLNYQIPGALVLLNGVYSTDGNVFEFKGHVRTEATASHMVTGWKSWLLKPVDPFLKKNGAGLQLPISVSGTQGDVHFGLAMHGTADQTSTEMAQDLKSKKQEMLDSARAKREKEKADKEAKKAGVSSGAARTRAEKKAEKERQKAERHIAAAEAAKHPDE